MNVIESKDGNTIAIGLGPDERLLESIKEVIKSHGVRDGAVVSGIGTLKRCHMHYVNTKGFPAENRFYVARGAAGDSGDQRADRGLRASPTHGGGVS